MAGQIMTDEEAVEKARNIKDKESGDKEGIHCKLDDLAMKILKENGYEKFVEVFNATDKWYA